MITSGKREPSKQDLTKQLAANWNVLSRKDKKVSRTISNLVSEYLFFKLYFMLNIISGRKVRYFIHIECSFEIQIYYDKYMKSKEQYMANMEQYTMNKAKMGQEPPA